MQLQTVKYLIMYIHFLAAVEYGMRKVRMGKVLRLLLVEETMVQRRLLWKMADCILWWPVTV